MKPVKMDPPQRNTKWRKALEFLMAHPDKWYRMYRGERGSYGYLQWLPAREPRITVTQVKNGDVYEIYAIFSTQDTIRRPFDLASYSQSLRLGTAQPKSRKIRETAGIRGSQKKEKK